MPITFTGHPKPVTLETLADDVSSLEGFVLQVLDELSAVRRLLETRLSGDEVRHPQGGTPEDGLR